MIRAKPSTLLLRRHLYCRRKEVSLAAATSKCFNGKRRIQTKSKKQTPPSWPVHFAINGSSSSHHFHYYDSVFPTATHDKSLRMLSSSPPNKTSTIWEQFTFKWNTTLSKNPQEVIAVFLAAQSTTWLTLYTTMISCGVLFPPEVALGWMIGRMTKKVRQPINLILATGIVRIVPSITDLKVSPLITGIATDPTTQKQIAEHTQHMKEQIPPNIYNAISKGITWIQGPIDQYGLAFYLSGKVSFLMTMGATSIAMRYGMNIEGTLSYWNVDPSLGEAVGTVAGSSALNALLVPVHFGAVVYGIQGMDMMAHKLYPHAPDTWREEYYQQQQHKSAGSGEHNQDTNSGEREYIENGIMKAIGMVLLVYSLGVSMYVLRLMSKSDKGDDDIDTKKNSNDEKADHGEIGN